MTFITDDKIKLKDGNNSTQAISSIQLQCMDQ